jgi:hypothetical protein
VRATRDPFVRRVMFAVTLTAVGMGVTPVISDLGVQPADGAGTLVWLALTLFGLSYGAILALSVLWSFIPSRRNAP